MPSRRARLLTWASRLLLAAVLAVCALSFLRAVGVTLVTVRRDPDGTTHLHSRMLISDYGGVILRRQVGWTIDPVIYKSVGETLPRGWTVRFGLWEAGEAWGPRSTLALLWFDTEWHPGGLMGSRYEVRGLRVPYWVPVLIAAMPLLLVRLRRRHRDRLRRQRAALGLCPTCGYDLRGNQGACPECGAMG